ncbi:protein of unknown function [Candidatus Filomicrobium marinum]|uniref:Uncharacterized protein n=1 Tax=Candidatus Filomicrobium marinum TaxID=1608628 RepID=A0A0D6JL56_9HYPH|nr:protein of unknown function [Candidatus Filomicrobium marinum]CPR22402.1 protein of unknown function [Candidatus Filomicrobium marinum]
MASSSRSIANRSRRAKISSGFYCPDILIFYKWLTGFSVFTTWGAFEVADRSGWTRDAVFGGVLCPFPIGKWIAKIRQSSDLCAPIGFCFRFGEPL